MRTIRIIAAAIAGTAAAAPLALTGASAATSSGASGAVAGTTVTAVTTITGRDVSGNNGNWALAGMNRTVSATLIGLHSGPECGTLSPCYQYTGLVIDNMRARATFQTDAGAFTPNQSTPGTTIRGTVNGTFTGGSQGGFTFYADSNALSTARVPVSVTGDAPAGTGRPTSPPSDGSLWITLLFPPGTHFAGSTANAGCTAGLGSATCDPLLPGWSWSYTDPVFCGHWTDAYNNGDGNLAADGNITGVSNCAVSVQNPGAQATQAGHPARLQIHASTTSTDQALSFAASGLPAGLSIAASGVISGTPAAVENTAIVTVTASDAAGSPPASVTFAWNVTAAPPPAASKLTAKDACGPDTGRRWKVSNVAGRRDRAFGYFTLLSSGRWHPGGSASVPARGSVTIITHRGTTLRLRWGNGLGRIVTAAFPVTTARAC
jgi:Putative Ig domain